LAPAEISRVIIDEYNRAMEVIVPDEFLSVAIGKRGQNVRLASKLTGWHLDVKSESHYSKALQDGYASQVALPGVGVSLADALYEKGFYSAEELSKASKEDLIQIRGIGEETALKLMEAAAANKNAPETPPENDDPAGGENRGKTQAESERKPSGDKAVQDAAADIHDSVPGNQSE
jgi:N utilization substance protein A